MIPPITDRSIAFHFVSIPLSALRFRVKLGVHEESGEQVAVKIMDKSDIKAQEMTMNVRREIAIMKALKHRNIVNLRQVLTSQSKLYIVMDLVTGGELFTKILNEGKLEEIIARRYFQQLVDGIEYCHRRGVCHRDLKPENLLIDETTGELKITDFGLSAMKGASTTEELLHTQCGSPNYCAPEIIARHKQGYNGNKVDAWSCGIILFALLAGFLPFYDENTKVLYRMIQRDDVKFPRKFPPDAKDLVLRLLHKEPEKRYTLGEVKKHPWFAIDYEGDDAVPKSTASGASPPASRRRRRGHSRKSSVDQAPRSRELREMVPRKKSGKSDKDSGGTASMPPIAPGGQPIPPPIVIDSGPRSVPAAHRPPAPPSISPPPPRSPLPPLPPPPPTTNSIAMQQSVPHTHGPLPPPPPPTVPPAPVSSYGTAGISRPVPPYPAVGVVRRKSREARDAHSNDVGSVTSGESSNAGSVAHSGITSSAVPSYSSLSEASHVPTPTFPAPGADGDRPNVHVYSPPPVRKSSGSSSNPMPNGALPPPPTTISSRPLGMSATTVPSVLPGVSPAPTPTALSFSPAPNHVERSTGVVGATAESDTVPEAPIGVSPMVTPAPRSDASLRAHLTPAEEKKAPPSPPRGVRKWTVSGPTPPPSYKATTMAPVTTPSALASGDGSWMKRAAARNENKVDTGRTVKFDVEQREEKEEQPLRVETIPEPEPPSRPLSIVERQRLLYNKLATESDVPPPLPDTSLRLSSFKIAPASSMKVEPKSAPMQRFGDRVEAPTLSGYPTGNAGTIADQEPPMSPPGIGNLSSRDGTSDVSVTRSPALYSKNDRTSSAANETGWTAAPSNIVELPERPDEVVDEKAKVEHVGDTTGGLLVGAGVTVLEDDDEGSAPLKQRLTAALARYRRIFKLGNNIGITSSPSFNSNRGSGISVGSGDDGKRPNSSSRAEFFARAKTITGAWGIILTQELDDDSDSEDDTLQVTEAELQAFSRLLDFWDNRRASATIPKGGEVVLDDESSTPLSEEDIASIQSLLQKLEPKQVEEEMTEVAEEAADLSNAQGISAEAPVPGEIVDSLEDLDVEDIHILPTGTARRSSEHSAPSDISLGAHSHSGEFDMARRSGQTAHATLTKPAPVSPPPPPPPPFAPGDGSGRPRTVPVPPPPSMPRRPKVDTVASWDRGTGTAVSVSAPPPPPPPPPRPVDDSRRGAMPPPPPPPPYAAPASSTTAVENQQQRMVMTQSTVRDPFRPRPPPSYPPPQSPGNGSVTILDDTGETDPRVLIETTAAVRRGARIPQSLSHDADLSLAIKRKSSTTTSEFDIEARKTVSRDSGRVYSGASAASDASGAGRGKHFRSPSRDEHATRGMFAFGMFNRRKSSPLTSFDSELAPDRCLLEIGRILTAMGCSVLMKRGESKMKCEAPLRQEKLLISITCTREKKVTTVHFKKGRKDRSQVDAKEFYEFFQKVHTRFHERVGSEVHVQN